MKIAIDLNDVVRAYTAQFASYYKKNIDRAFDIDDLDIWTNDLKEIFPFESKQKYLEFLYDDYAYEIHACAQPMDKNMGSRLTDWCKEIEDLDEVPELCIVSTGEYNKTIGSTHFFLSKISSKIRETHLFLKEDDAWDVCDVLITANPILLSLKPSNKVSIKIKSAYNESSDSDFEYETFVDFMGDINAIEKLNNKLNEK